MRLSIEKEPDGTWSVSNEFVYTVYFDTKKEALEFLEDTLEEDKEKKKRYMAELHWTEVHGGVVDLEASNLGEAWDITKEDYWDLKDRIQERDGIYTYIETKEDKVVRVKEIKEG